jgi:hypothetical protein
VHCIGFIIRIASICVHIWEHGISHIAFSWSPLLALQLLFAIKVSDVYPLSMLQAHVWQSTQERRNNLSEINKVSQAYWLFHLLMWFECFTRNWLLFTKNGPVIWRITKFTRSYVPSLVTVPCFQLTDVATKTLFIKLLFL